MHERQRVRRPVGRGSFFGGIRSALGGDVMLAARVAGTAVGIIMGGLIGALALALLGVPGRAAPSGWALLGLALLLALALGALAIARRRRAREAQRARARVGVALTLLALGTIVGVLDGVGQSRVIAAGAGVVAAIGVLLAGLRSYAFVASAVARMAMARRQAWYAQLRASRLTRRMLGYAAYRQLRRDGALPVKSLIHPHRTYLVPIRTTPSGARILVLDGERPIGGLCLRPRLPLPDPEEALTHILAIRTDERAWLDRANFFPQDRALTPQARGLAPGRPGNYER